jgi:D-inositol-3-phosphate glycosyltransferase
MVARTLIIPARARLGKKRRRGDNDPVRIAMISYHTCPLATLGGKDTGGMNVYVRDLTRELGRRSVGVDVFTRSQDEHVPHVLHDLGYGNRIVHVPAGPERPLPRERLIEHLPGFVERILEFARSKGLRYDLIHSHYWMSGLAGLSLRSEWGAPLLHMFHTLGAMKNRVAREPEEPVSSLRLESEARLLQECDRIIAATQAELAQFQWLYRAATSNVVVIPPGVDTARFYPIDGDEAKQFVGIPEHNRMILFVGRIEPLKGLDTLLEAMALLAREGFVDRGLLCLAVIGGDADLAPEAENLEMGRLQQLREKLGLGDLVAFLGRRDQDTLPYYYSASDVVVVPSHYESFGLVALEAMACGRPVVASETGGLVFLVRDGETGFHVPAGDAAALADRLRTLMRDDLLRERLGRKAAAYARNYAWPRIVDQILEVYNSLVPQPA